MSREPSRVLLLPSRPGGPRTTTDAMNGFPNGAHGSGADPWRGSDGAGDPGGLHPSLAEIAAKASEKVNEVRQYPVCAPVLQPGKPAERT